MKDWFAPGQIRFTVREALWLIQNLGSLQNGHWPPEASNYVDFIGKKSGRHKAPFETAAEYYAEITDRLERCGQDGRRYYTRDRRSGGSEDPRRTAQPRSRRASGRARPSQVC